MSYSVGHKYNDGSLASDVAVCVVRAWDSTHLHGLTRRAWLITGRHTAAHTAAQGAASDVGQARVRPLRLCVRVSAGLGSVWKVGVKA